MNQSTITIVVDDQGQPISHPTIYDLSTDTRRPVTQDDVDRLLRTQAEMAKIVRIVEELTKRRIG